MTLVQTGSLPQLDALLDEIPESVLAMLRIPGLGPKKAALLYQQLGIVTLEQLQQACETQQVRELKGFGPKTEEAILKGMEIAKAAGKRIYWSEADKIVKALRHHFGMCDAVQKLQFAGSYRRGKETVGDLDILVLAEDHNRVMDHLAEFEEDVETMVRGDTKMSIRLRKRLQVDLRVVPAESWGAALQYFTGSKEHNVLLRGRAKQRGLKVNEYGVYRQHGETSEYVAGATEDDVYGSLDLPTIPPELREGRQEFTWAEGNALPKLVTEADIVGDLHMHTTATDGLDTLEKMVEAGRNRGLQYIAITDHSQRVTMAQGLNPKRLLLQWKMIDAINKASEDGFRVLKGIEVDILEKGGLDLPDDVLAQGDWVVASIHYGQRQSQQQITERIVGALENPYVSAIAHPTGRLINRREAYEVDIDSVLRAASKHGKMLELNANPARLDLNDVHCAAAKELQIPIVIASDAHSVNGLNVMRFGVLQARRGGLTRHDVANTRPWSELKKMFGR